MKAMNRSVLAPFGAVFLWIVVAPVRADEGSSVDPVPQETVSASRHERADASSAIDPASVDDITLAISRLAIETKADDIPQAAFQAAKAAALDALGCAFAGHDAPSTPAIVGLMKEWGGREESTIWFDGAKVPGPAAAFANSVQLHALDFDDYHPPSDTHVTSVLVPAVLAMGEWKNASGKETLAALILGAEVVGRLGRAYKGRRAHSGFLPTSVIGGFGATAAACRLQGCSVAQTVNAMGIWYAHASGTRQALFDRTLTKRIQPAIAARAGVFASYLAGEDITGPRRIFGKQGASLTQIYGCRRDAKPPTVGEIMAARKQWQIEQLQYKCYACCGVSDRVIRAAAALSTKHDLKPEDIKELRIFGDEVCSPFGGVAWGESATPQVLAQFCIPYAAASAIRNRRYGSAEIAPSRIAEDREVDALARRTRMCEWSQWEGPRPKGHTVVQVLANDGRKLEAMVSGSERFSWPADYPQLLAKFRSNVAQSGRIEETAIGELISAIENLEACASIRAFIEKWLVFRD